MDKIYKVRVEIPEVNAHLNNMGEWVFDSKVKTYNTPLLIRNDAEHIYQMFCLTIKCGIVTIYNTKYAGECGEDYYVCKSKEIK